MNFDVVVVGGGVVGGTLALALAQAGVDVAIVDPRDGAPPPPRDFDQRVYALRPSSIELLRRCAVWPRVDDRRVAPVYRMAVYGDDGASTLSFDAYRSGVEQLAVIVEDFNLQTALLASLAEQPLLTRLAGRRCVGTRWAS
jgi:2-polyprenylphenol 6-hydroxylase